MSGKDMKISCLTLHHLKNWSAEDPAASIFIFCYITTYRALNPKSSGGLWWLYHQFLHSKIKGTAEGKQDFFSCGNKRRILKLLLYRKIIVPKWGQYWYLVQSWQTSPEGPGCLYVGVWCGTQEMGLWLLLECSSPSLYCPLLSCPGRVSRCKVTLSYMGTVS